LEREKQVIPEATAKIYAAVINTNEMQKKFPEK